MEFDLFLHKKLFYSNGHTSLELRMKMFGSLIFVWHETSDWQRKYRLYSTPHIKPTILKKKKETSKEEKPKLKSLSCTKAKRYCFQTVTSNGNNNWFKNHCVCRYVDFVLKKCCLNLCFLSYFPSTSDRVQRQNNWQHFISILKSVIKFLVLVLFSGHSFYFLLKEKSVHSTQCYGKLCH